jgi:hypothetical protein
MWQPTHLGNHLGLIVDLMNGEFRAPTDKLQALAKIASALLGRAATTARWLPARQLAAFASKAQFLYLAIAPSRFFLRKLHCVLATRKGWGGRVRMTHQLRRDLEWWRTVPDQHNGRSIYKSIYLCIYIFIYLSIYLFIYQSIYLFIHPISSLFPLFDE